MIALRQLSADGPGDEIRVEAALDLNAAAAVLRQQLFCLLRGAFHVIEPGLFHRLSPRSSAAARQRSQPRAGL